MSTPIRDPSPIWTRRIADEFWSGSVTPLTYSLLGEAMAEHLVRRPLRSAGLRELAELPILHRHACHVYVNAGLLASVIELLPAALRTDGLLDLLPAEARSRVGAGSSWIGGGATAVAIALRSWLHEPAWAPWRRAAAFEVECAAVRGELEKPLTFGGKPSPAEVVRELHKVRLRLGRYLDVVSWGVVFAYVFYHLLHELCRHWAPGLDAERAALTVGLPGIASLEVHQELRQLAALLAADPAVAGALAAGGAQAVADALAGDAGASGSAFRRFLERHGHRLTGRDLACPTWRECPAMLVELCLHRDPGPVRPAPLTTLDPSAAEVRRLEATTRIERALATPLHRGVFRLALAWAQRYYALRENMRYHADFFLARLREIALALARDLERDGRLAAADDVFWLDLAEFERALTGDPTLAGVARDRRRDAGAVASPPPETLGNGPPSPPPREPTSVLTGEVGAPGRCRGRARLVRGPADFERVGDGEVLVAVYTDPGWTPILERAAGLVLEAGGLLSHGAIVARELAIPALVGVADALATIRDGDTVEVDGVGGAVTIVARADADSA